MNSNWCRWIKASCIKHFSDSLSSYIPLFVEGTDRRTESEQSYCEFRIDGPHASELSRDFWELDIVINILVVTIRTDGNIYQHETNVGVVFDAFINGITVKRYGPDSMIDDQSILGCLNKREKIIVSNFGQVQNDMRMIQSTVEARYRLNLT